jgi:hypothetical protein
LAPVGSRPRKADSLEAVHARSKYDRSSPDALRPISQRFPAPPSGVGGLAVCLWELGRKPRPVRRVECRKREQERGSSRRQSRQQRGGKPQGPGVWWRICTLPPRNNGWPRFEPPSGRSVWWHHVLSSAQQGGSHCCRAGCVREGLGNQVTSWACGQGSVPTLCLCCLAKLIQTISIQELDPEGLKRGKPVMAGEFFEAVACEGPRWLTHRGWPSGSRWHLTMGPKASHLKGPVLCHIDASFGRTAESFLGLDSGGSSPNLAKLTSLPVRPLDEGCRTQPGLGRTVAVGLSGAEVTTQGLTHCFCLGKSMTHRFPATRGVLGHRGSPGFGTSGKTVAGEI